MQNEKINQIQHELAQRELARRNFKHFLLLKWQRYNKAYFMDNWHFDYICALLTQTLSDKAKANHKETITRLMLNMPPSYGKTETIARSFIAWALGQDRSRKFIYISYSDELCKKISNQVRDLLKSSFWQSIFKEKPVFLQDNSSEFILKEGGGLFVTTLKSAITGFHAHSILIDDPIKVSAMSSNVERNAVNQNFKESVLSRLQNNESNITILMQRLGYEDLCGFLLDERNFTKDIIDKWKIIKLEALNDEPCKYEALNFCYERKANEPLFPARHDKKELDELRLQMGEDEFSAQYQQEPQAKEAGFFEASFFKEVFEYELKEQNEYIFVDNAMSLNANADNRAIVCIGVESLEQNLPRFIVKSCFYGIFDEDMMSKKIIEMALLYPKAKIFIENDGGGIVLRRILDKALVKHNNEAKQTHRPLCLNEITNYTANRKISKVEKIKALKPFYNAGHLVFLHSLSGKEQVKKELLSFNPNKPFRKDDCIDAIASCVMSEFVFAPAFKVNKPLPSHRFGKKNQTTWRV